MRLSVVCLFVIAGCGGNPNKLETGYVTGKVLLDGQPAASGRVFFYPVRGRMAMGEIKPDGSYTLSVYGSQDGAIVGENKIAVAITAEGKPSDGEVGHGVVWLIPEYYGSESTSGLSCTVKPGANVHDIQLQSKATTAPTTKPVHVPGQPQIPAGHRPVDA